jgi:hypothetical protein
MMYYNMTDVNPLYNYHKNIKSPGELGMSPKGSLNQMATNVMGLIDYVEILVTGGGKASKTGKPLGNKFYVSTGSQCKDIDKSKNVSRHIYMDNVPKGNIPLISQGMGKNFTSFKGLVPGAVENLNALDPSKIFNSISGGVTPDCKNVKLKVIGNDNKEKHISKYVSIQDLENIDKSNFVNKKEYDDLQVYLNGINTKIESLSNFETPSKGEKITIKNNKNKDMNKPFNESLDDSAPFLEYKAIKKNKKKLIQLVPDDILVKLFYASMGALGILILIKLLNKRRLTK